MLLFYLKGIYYFNNDISMHLSKIHKNGSINALELAEIGNFLDTIRDVFNYFSSIDDKIEIHFLDKTLSHLTYPKDLNLKIRRIVTPYGEIKDDASSNLGRIRKDYNNLEKNIASKMQEILAKNSSKLSQATISIRNDRYVIPIKSAYKNQVKGIIHDESSSGETVYIEPLIICEMNNKLQSLYEEEKREIEFILKQISLEIDNYYDELLLSFDGLVHYDLVFGKAKLALKNNYNKPNINNNGILELYNAYHPLLNVSNIVKNNIIIGHDYKGVIITGPNTGGKTVLLKTIGIISLMVKLGMLVPCEENSNVMIFDDVFADIGDEQSISQNLSTFSSHMANVINIINNVTNSSLVLLDELGSGTDPVEGSSIAISVFDYLLKRNCILVATSHYSELKLHAYKSDNIINASVEFDSVSLKPTYKLLLGIPGESNAIEVARNLGLKKEIIDDAIKYSKEKDDKISNVLDKLVKQSFLLDKKINEVEENKKTLEEKISLENELLEKAKEESNKIINNAIKEKDKIIQDSKDEILDILDQLKYLSQKGKGNIKANEIADVKYQIRHLADSSDDVTYFNDNVSLNEGDRVYIRKYNTYGIISKIKNNDKVIVIAGNMTLTVDKDDLTIDKSQEKFKGSIENKEISPIKLKKNVSAKLDLRGMRYDEASDAIDKYIDDCIVSGINSMTIIHGFGSGVLRKLVNDKLKGNDNILEYRYGGETEGGFGATIVTLKENK